MIESENLNKISNVFVLMLENHSFDNIFAMSGISGITAATLSDCNSWTPPGATSPNIYSVKKGAPPFMPTDPSHEFDDVLEQLTGAIPECKLQGGAYPKIDRSGYAANYATKATEKTWKPECDQVGDIMACFDTQKQLPVIHALATEFAICDHWFSSIPGPTWPNRFFVHGASSANWTDSPGLINEVEWLGVPELGFRYEHGSIFQALDKKGLGWRIYQDKANQFSDNASGPEYGGWISQAASLHGVNLLDVMSLECFTDDLNEMVDGEPAYRKYPYTFIEPNFGKSFFDPQPGQDSAPKSEQKWYDGPTYKGGSSQHPEDDPSGGEGLIKAVYEAIRASPLWETSVLILVYDEHGGFYDSVCPEAAVAPGDKSPILQTPHNAKGFDFKTYGVRVPAVIVSPLIPNGIVDKTIYDHSSVAATVERLLGLESLTDRDAAACDIGHLLSLSSPRDCPKYLPDPVHIDPATTPVEPPLTTDNSLPTSGNAVGFLQILLKAELEISGKTKAQQRAIFAKFKKITTKDMGKAFIKEMYDLIEGIQAERRKIHANKPPA